MTTEPTIPMYALYKITRYDITLVGLFTRLRDAREYGRAYVEGEFIKFRVRREDWFRT